MTIRSAPVAAVEGVSSSTVQVLLEEMVARWRAAGVHVVGVLEEGHGLPGRTCNAGLLRDIVSGTRYSIYRDVLLNATSCHIDAAGAQKAGTAVLCQVAASDLVVLSKFGKLEAAGDGLFAVFDAAIAAQKPVLTTVSNLRRKAWRACMPTATTLPATASALQDWWADVTTESM